MNRKSCLNRVLPYINICKKLRYYIYKSYDYIINNLSSMLFNNKIYNGSAFIPTPDWLNKRRAIINIRNNDNDCFFKCIYRYFNREKYHHDYRDINSYDLNKFLSSRNIDRNMFANGISTESLMNFEKTYKIGINIFSIDSRGPQFTKHEYVSMYNNTNEYPIINLGYLIDGNKGHFVLIVKLNCVLTEKYKSHIKPICLKCNTIFSTRQELTNHKLLKHSVNGCVKS
jgi:hypothetical protein